VYVLLSLLLFDPKPFVGGDNAAYVSLSKSLVQGKGLTEIWTPEQRPHTQYPFGFPLLLAPISLLKLPYAWYKIIPWLAGLAGILLSWLLFDRQGRAPALAVCLLLAMNPHFLEYGHWVLSELPFMALMLLSLWCLSRWEERGGWLWFLGSLAAAAASAHVRSAGVALLAAAPVHLAIRRKFKWSLLYLAAGLALMVPWALRNARCGTAGGYLDQFLMLDPYQPELGRAAFGDVVSRIWTNLRLYLGSIWPQLLLPGTEVWGAGAGRVFAFLLLSVPAIAGAAAGARRVGAAAWLLFAYLAMSALWPAAWTDLRFALPVLPLLAYFLLLGYSLVLRAAFGRASVAAAAALLLALAAGNAAATLGRTGDSLRMKAEYRRGDRLAGYAAQWRSFFQAAEWIKGNTPQGSVVVSRKPQLFFLAAGRRSFCYPFTADAGSLRAELAKADYVMVEPVSGTVQRYLIPAIQPGMDKDYRLIQAAGNPPTYVLQVLKENGHGK